MDLDLFGESNISSDEKESVKNGDDGQDDSLEVEDDKSFQDAAQMAAMIENNLLDDSGSQHGSANEADTKDSRSMFGGDIIFPEMRRDSTNSETKERNKRKEQRNKKELEEEEREKMQLVFCVIFK